MTQADQPATQPAAQSQARFRELPRSSRALRRALAAFCLLASSFASHAAIGLRAHPAASQQQRSVGYLGIAFHDVSDAEATALHEKGTRGILIVAVDHDGPAGKSGLRPQDIITAINGDATASTQSLSKLIHDAGAGYTLTLALVRQGKTLRITTALADQHQVERDAWPRPGTIPQATPIDPNQDPASAEEGRRDFTEPPPPVSAKGGPLRGQTFLGTVLHTGPFTGLDLEVMTPQLAGFFGASDGNGLLIQSVTPNSPAAEAGLRAGDVLVKADGQPLHSTTAWGKHLRAAKGRPVAVTILRNRQEQTLTLTLDTRKHSLLEWPHTFKGDE